MCRDASPYHRRRTNRLKVRLGHDSFFVQELSNTARVLVVGSLTATRCYILKERCIRRDVLLSPCLACLYLRSGRRREERARRSRTARSRPTKCTCEASDGISAAHYRRRQRFLRKSNPREVDSSGSSAVLSPIGDACDPDLKAATTNYLPIRETKPGIRNITQFQCV
jgi:hypothetical protein